MNRLRTVRTYGALNAGIVAGLFGLNGISGVVCFVALFFIVSIILMYKTSFNVKNYFLNS